MKWFKKQSRNMGYVRFENTFSDLYDCLEHINDDDLTESEKNYRKKIIVICKRIIEEYIDDGNELAEDRMG